MNQSRLDEILNLTQSFNISLIWGLPYPGAYATNNLGDSVDVPVWNATNAFDLLAYAGDAFEAVELAEELTPLPESQSFQNLIEAYLKLRAFSQKIRIHGPCVGMVAETNDNVECLHEDCGPSPFMQAFIDANLIDTLCVHSYDNDAGANWTQLPCSTSQLIRQLKMLQQCTTSIPIVCGECGPHNNGGLNVTDTASSAYWFVSALGDAARLGVSHFARQTLIGSHYGLVDNSDTDYGAPNPDFWVAVLFARLMGPQVLDIFTSGDNEKMSLYAHCSALNSSSIGLAFVNYDENLAVDLDLSNLIEGHNKEEWIFTTRALTSKDIFVNGKPIHRQAPEITLPVPRLSSGVSLHIPALSFGFVHFPTTVNALCSA